MADTIISRLLLGLDTREFRNGIRNADRGLQEFSKNIQNIGNLIGASFAVGIIQDFTIEAVKLGDQLSAAGKGFERFGDAADLNELRKSTRGMVTDVQLLQQAVQAGNFGIPIEELGNLFAFAQQRAKETGQEVDYLTDSIVKGIGRKSPLILDNLGISAVALKEKLGGVAAETASIAEVTKAVSEIATEELAKMGGSADDTTTKTKQLATAWENWKARSGQVISEQTGQISNFLLQIEFAKQILTTLVPGALGRFFFGSNDEGGSNFARAMETVTQTIEEQQRAIDGVKRAYNVFNPEAVKVVTTLSSLKDDLKTLQEEFETVDVSTARFTELRKEIEKVQARLRALTNTKTESAPKGEVVDPSITSGILDDITADLFKGSMSWLQYEEAMVDALDPSPLENFMVYHQDMTDEIIPGIQEIVTNYDRLNKTISTTASVLGNVLQESFEAALVNGEDFFKVLLDGLKKMAMRLAATAAAAFALSIALKSMGIGNGASLGNIFKVVGGQMGIPGLGGSSFNPTTGVVEGGLFGGRTTLRGNDIYLANSRSGYDLGRIG